MFARYHRVSPGITGYHSTRLFYGGAAALLKRGRGDVPRLAVPPAHDYQSQNFDNNLMDATYFKNVESVKAIYNSHLKLTPRN
jgi:hypothetical protein